MQLELTTPALLFPAISLLMLAYTNRFVVLADLIRKLVDRSASDHNDSTLGQIDNLRRRILIIQRMQVFGALSFFFCVLTMFTLFFQLQLLADILFALALLLLLGSLFLLLLELRISVIALTLQLDDAKKTR